MIQLAGWVVLCLLIAWLLQNRPIQALCLAIAMWSAVPSISGHHLTGVTSGIGFHPATFLVLCVLLVQLLFHPSLLAEAFSRHIYSFWIVIIFVIGARLTSSYFGSGGLRLLMDQIVGPVALFWVLIAFGEGERRLLILVRNVIIAVVAAQCILTVVQWRLGDILFYPADFANRVWFDPDRGFDRWFGTADSPLVLSLAISVAAALTVGLQRAWLRFLLLTLYVVGSVITQSRTGTALTMVIVIWTILRARVALWTRVFSIAALGAAIYAIASSVLIQGLTQRLINDTGSTDARLRALRYVTSHWLDFLFTGRGLTSSYTLGRDAGLRTSIESSYLMYAVDTGFVLATIFFGMQLVLLIRHRSQKGVPGATLGALVGCFLQHTFSGIAGSNLTGTLIWATLGLVVAGGSMSRRDLEEDVEQPAIQSSPRVLVPSR
jgi:hypothetical protein